MKAKKAIAESPIGTMAHGETPSWSLTLGSIKRKPPATRHVTAPIAAKLMPGFLASRRKNPTEASSRTIPAMRTGRMPKPIKAPTIARTPATPGMESPG
jgi:hypothetical protein